MISMVWHEVTQAVSHQKVTVHSCDRHYLNISAVMRAVSFICRGMELALLGKLVESVLL